MDARKVVHKENRERTNQSSSVLRQRAPSSLNRAILYAQEKGASSWLTALHLEEFNLSLFGPTGSHISEIWLGLGLGDNIFYG